MGSGPVLKKGKKKGVNAAARIGGWFPLEIERRAQKFVRRKTGKE